MTTKRNDCQFCRRCSGIDCDKEFCLRKFKLEELFRKSMITPELFNLTYTDFSSNKALFELNKESYQRLMDIVGNISKFFQVKNNIVIYSEPTQTSINSGCGKTSWATIILLSYLMSIWPRASLECKALFVDVPRFLSDLPRMYDNNESYSSKIKSLAYDADLVVWDGFADYHVEKYSDNEYKNLFSIINSRAHNKKLNVYTTNVNPVSRVNNKFSNICGTLLKELVIRNSELIELKGISNGGNN